MSFHMLLVILVFNYLYDGSFVCNELTYGRKDDSRFLMECIPIGFQYKDLVHF